MPGPAAQLPAGAAEALLRWDCRADGDLLRGGMSVVLPVRRGDEPLMLKLLPAEAARLEALALAAFPRDAAVECLAHDAELGALLLERLSARSLAGEATDLSITVQADLARRLAVAAPAVPGAEEIPPLSADAWLAHLASQRAEAPRVLSARALGAAREAITSLDEEPCPTMTHGDLHARNVHLDDDGCWRALDPTPRRGTIAHESHTVVLERDRFEELISAGPAELRRRLDLFAEVAGVDAALARRLCQARAVSSALHEAVHGPAALTGALTWMAETLAAVGD
ncbi:aminoglycoside phosphotransferase family protein [Brachybacterium hainanense]|uniref:Aminoglycoside phosphotransferase family protein n=1 Tax=Brachybacterium hainanense TaxID=1541174 RepID=A0ABV6R9L9_9MICO